MSDIVVRPVELGDRTAWEPLWKGYQQFYKVDLPAEVTETTWQRFHNPAEPVYALVAEREGQLIGVTHYLFHRSTWMLGRSCYLQDLFVAPEARGHGVGRLLIEAVYRAAKVAGAERVHWLTHETNSTAMHLYDRIADRSGFVQYRKNL
ncbi:MAG: GNAT family N-acetyltransferase [Roseiflexaceae bacterium]